MHWTMAVNSQLTAALQFIKQLKSVSCQSQTENHISQSSTTDQSNQIQLPSNQISVSSTDQNTNQPLPQGTNITYTENPPDYSTKQYQTHNLPVYFKNSHSSLNIQLIDNIPQTLRPKNLTQIKQWIKEFSSQQINIQYSTFFQKVG